MELVPTVNSKRICNVTWEIFIIKDVEDRKSVV